MRYTEGHLVGHRHYESKSISPLWWLGYGLSYTTFSRELLGVHGTITSDGGVATAVVQVTNTDKRVGKDVVQI